MKDWYVIFGSIENTGRHLNEGLSLYLVLRGEITLEWNQQTAVMPADSCFVINDGELFRIESQKANAILGVNISHPYLERECPEFMSCSLFCNSLYGTDGQEQLFFELKRQIAQMAFLYLGEKEGWQFLFRSELYRALGCLYMNFRVRDFGRSENLGEDERLHSILEFIRTNYRDRISLEELAAREFLSPQYISRMFHRKMGIPLTKYLASLRLEKSIRELLDTNNTIAQIALSHGFANVRAFNKQFKEVYQDTPAGYRKKNQREAKEKSEWFYTLGSIEKEPLETLVRYLKTYNQDGGRTLVIREEADAAHILPESFPDCAKILNIGSMNQALRQDVQQQLAEVSRKLRFQYAYLWRFVGDSFDTFAYPSYLQLSDYYSLFDTLYKLGWSPFLRIDIDELLDPLRFTGMEAALRHLKSLLECLVLKYENAYWKSWKFDISGTFTQLEQHYEDICDCIHSVLSGAETGFFLNLSQDIDWHAAESFLGAQKKTDICFLTFCLDLNFQYRVQRGDKCPIECCAGNQIKRLQSFMDSHGFEKREYYLLDWNTLTGSNYVESGEFHRSALFIDQFLRNAPLVNGMGIRLNLFHPYMKELPVHATYFLSLYLCGAIKRPPFFLLEMLEACRKSVFLMSSQAIATWNMADSYALLLFHPQYLDPEAVIGNIGRDAYKKTYQVLLKGLRPGHYRIKKMTLDKNHGSIYHGMSGIDKTRSLNMEEANEYLAHMMFPDVVIYEADIGDTYEIYQNLLLNAVVFYTLKRLY